MERHACEVRSWTKPYAARRATARPHPIHDFLFTYYHYSMRKLEAWHPGLGIQMEDDGEPCPWQDNRFYGLMTGVWEMRPRVLQEKEILRLRWIATLLQATAGRTPNFACHGLHEWAMVYRATEVRHEGSAPLRLPQEEVDNLVRSRPLTCSHFDAFRFFAPTAQPLNRFQPTLDSRPALEQPGCVHANMDLYKWAYKSMPWIGSELLMEAFHLALALRELDMRASPYDLRAFGYEPIPIETAEGRKDYEVHQRALAERSAKLRSRLAEMIEGVIDASTASA